MQGSRKEQRTARNRLQGRETENLEEGRYTYQPLPFPSLPLERMY